MPHLPFPPKNLPPLPGPKFQGTEDLRWWFRPTKFQESQSSRWYSRPWQTQTWGFWVGIFQRKVGRCKLERVFFLGGFHDERLGTQNWWVTKQSWILWNLGLNDETCSLFQFNSLMDNGHKSSCYKSLGITSGIMKGIKYYFFHNHPISQIISQNSPPLWPCKTRPSPAWPSCQIAQLLGWNPRQYLHSNPPPEVVRSPFRSVECKQQTSRSEISKNFPVKIGFFRQPFLKAHISMY